MNKIKRTISEKGLSDSGKLLLMLITVIFAGVLFYMIDPGNQSDVNPFAGYENLRPDQSADGLEASGFVCYEVNSPSFAHSTSCVPGETSEPAMDIEIRVSGGIIQRVTFEPESGSLTIEDLFEIWGEAEIQEHSSAVYLFWRDHDIVAIAPGCQDSALLSLDIWRVYFFS